MTQDEWTAELATLFPSEINGITRPTTGIPTDLDFSTDFPQFISQDPARYDSWNAFLRQLFSNDALFNTWITELQTALTNQDFDLATEQIKGLMSAADKTKLDGIATGAEVNQNAFSNILVGSTTIAADGKTDTLTLAAGANVTLTPDATNDKVTIAATDTTYGVVSTAAAGLVPVRDGSTTKYLRADGSWATVSIPTSLPANGGTSAACSGNAATATKLATARTINGVSFDGTTNITIVVDSTYNFNLFKNFKSQVTSNTAATFTADYNPFTQASMSLTLSMSSTGANKLDTGTVAASRWYFPYIIYGTSGIACIASLSSTKPTLPTGYTSYIRVPGALITNASGYLYRTITDGNKTQYVVDGTVLTGMRVMASGNAGSITTPTLVSVGTGSYVPTTAATIKVVLLNNGASTTWEMVAPNANYGAYNSVSNPPPAVISNISAGIGTLVADLVLESTNLYWAASGLGAYLYCLGWEENL